MILILSFLSAILLVFAGIAGIVMVLICIAAIAFAIDDYKRKHRKSK